MVMLSELSLFFSASQRTGSFFRLPLGLFLKSVCNNGVNCIITAIFRFVFFLMPTETKKLQGGKEHCSRQLHHSASKLADAHPPHGQDNPNEDVREPPHCGGGDEQKKQSQAIHGVVSCLAGRLWNRPHRLMRLRAHGIALILRHRIRSCQRPFAMHFDH
jgi:hypothetical protein